MCSTILEEWNGTERFLSCAPKPEIPVTQQTPTSFPPPSPKFQAGENEDDK